MNTSPIGVCWSTNTPETRIWPSALAKQKEVLTLVGFLWVKLHILDIVSFVARVLLPHRFAVNSLLSVGGLIQYTSVVLEEAPITSFNDLLISNPALRKPRQTTPVQRILKDMV